MKKLSLQSLMAFAVLTLPLGPSALANHSTGQQPNSTQPESCNRTRRDGLNAVHEYTRLGLHPVVQMMIGGNPMDLAAENTGPSYHEINQALRLGQPLTHKMARTVGRLAFGVKLMPQYDYNTAPIPVRHENLTDEQVEQLYTRNIGKRIKKAAFTSSSTSLTFSRGNTRLAIVPAERPDGTLFPSEGYDIAPASSFRSEAEVVYLPGQEFEVVHMERYRARHTVADRLFGTERADRLFGRKYDYYGTLREVPRQPEANPTH